MGGIVDLPFGLATSVGALPVTAGAGDGLAPAAAVELALEAQPRFPTVPSSGGVGWSMLAQAVAGLDGVQVTPPGLLQLPDAGVVSLGGAVDVVGPEFELLERFLAEPAHDDRLGVRVGLLGPVSLTLALRAAGLDLDTAGELAATLVPARAVALLRSVRTEVPDGVVAVVMNEPGLIGAMHPTFPLAPSQVLDLLTPVVHALDAAALGRPTLIGAHVPGRTDWETVICSGVSLISAPADQGLLGWAEVLSQFFAAGGRIAWGAVPVDQPLGTGEELLWRRLSALWCQLVGEGLDPLQLRSSSLTGPVDGLGHFGVSQAARALDLVDSLAERVRRQAIGARLSLGA